LRGGQQEVAIRKYINLRRGRKLSLRFPIRRTRKIKVEGGNFRNSKGIIIIKIMKNTCGKVL